MADNQFQSWNSRSKKWCLFENGRIKSMQPEKWEGVPVKKGKKETDSSDTTEKKELEKKMRPQTSMFPWMDWYVDEE